MGAALAVLAALDIALTTPQFRKQIQLYTYACSRVGNPAFATLHAQQIPNSYRIVNLADPMPLMPPTQSVGTYVHMGQEWSFLSQNGDFMPNHVVDTYWSVVEGEVETDRSRNYPILDLGVISGSYEQLNIMVDWGTRRRGDGENLNSSNYEYLI